MFSDRADFLDRVLEVHASDHWTSLLDLSGIDFTTPLSFQIPIHGPLNLQNVEEGGSNGESSLPVHLVGSKWKGSGDDSTTSRAEGVPLHLPGVPLPQLFSGDRGIRSGDREEQGGRWKGSPIYVVCSSSTNLNTT